MERSKRMGFSTRQETRQSAGFFCILLILLNLSDGPRAILRDVFNGPGAGIGRRVGRRVGNCLPGRLGAERWGRRFHFRPSHSIPFISWP